MENKWNDIIGGFSCEAENQSHKYIVVSIIVWDGIAKGNERVINRLTQGNILVSFSSRCIKLGNKWNEEKVCKQEKARQITGFIAFLA